MSKHPVNTIIVLLFCVALNSYACQHQKNNKGMNSQESNPQHADTGRLLTVANLEQSDSGRKVTAWFFETPQIFELNLGNAEANTMFNLLKEAKEKQSPVNVYTASAKNKNSIIKVVPPTETQLAAYTKEKAGREQPKQVPPPQNQ